LIRILASSDADALDVFFRTHGFAIRRGLYSPDDLAAMLAECVDAQTRVANGELAERHGNSILTDAAAGSRFANYVQYITLIAPATRGRRCCIRRSAR